MSNNNDFMDFFLPGGAAARVKQTALDLAERIDKLLARAQAENADRTQAQIDAVIDEEVGEFARALSEQEVNDLRKEVQRILAERGRSRSPALPSVSKTASAFKSIKGRPVRADAAAMVVGAVTHGVVAMRRSRKARLAWPPAGARRHE